MKDPLVTIMAKLKEEWALTGALAVDNIKFSTGWYESEIETPQVTITEVSSTDELWEIGYGTIRVRGIYQADIWVTIVKTTGKGRGIAKSYKWAMTQEVKRILKANLTGLTDLWYVKLDETGRSLDQIYKSPPVLRYNLRFIVIYSI